MNILLLGSGGRESALAWKISQSPECSSLIIAPGNGGTARYGRNLPLKPTDFNAVLEAIRENAIDMVVVGNEDPLVGGITDFLAAEAPEVLVVAKERAWREARISPSSSWRPRGFRRPVTAASRPRP